MGGAIDPNAIPLPSGWSVFAKGYLLRAVGLARYALTHVRSCLVPFDGLELRNAIAR